MGVLGASWGRLGASWGRLGASWGRLGVPRGQKGLDSFFLVGTKPHFGLQKCPKKRHKRCPEAPKTPPSALLGGAFTGSLRLVLRCLAVSCLVLFCLVWSSLFWSCLASCCLVLSCMERCWTCRKHCILRYETHVELFSCLVWSRLVWSYLVLSLRRLGTSLGRLWGVFVTSLGRLCDVLGRLGDVLGASSQV